MTDAPEKPLNSFLDGVEHALQDEEETPWIVYGPRWAQEGQGAEEPPEDLENPVWAPSTGWMEKGEAPIGEAGSGETLAMYAPDSMDELSVNRSSESG